MRSHHRSLSRAKNGFSHAIALRTTYPSPTHARTIVGMHAFIQARSNRVSGCCRKAVCQGCSVRQRQGDRMCGLKESIALLAEKSRWHPLCAGAAAD
eukprot:2078541-Pleurochrysis_carterae.AAC.1